MKKEHNYQLIVKWTGNTGTGTSGYKDYERSHFIQAENKTAILGSSDPAFRGDSSKYNPEELLLASLSACHMLWYLHLCADAGVVVVAFKDYATGIMAETQGGVRFKEVVLNPLVKVGNSSMIDKANQVHAKVNEHCFIANSVNFPVLHRPTTSERSK